MKTESEYRHFVNQRCGTIGRDRLLLAAMGLCGEAGEVMEIWKKHLISHKTLDRDDLLEEMGDVFWYFTLMMIDNGFDLDMIVEANMEKLRKRQGENNERS